MTTTKEENKKRKEQINKANKLTIMNAIKDVKEQERLKQKEIATLLGIKQPRVSDLLNLKYKRFSIDILINYLDDFGFIVNFEKVDTNRGKPIKVNIINIKKKII
ncbi:helix-turn-helix domain-containing protein [Vibrio cyclitrophicus]